MSRSLGINLLLLGVAGIALAVLAGRSRGSPGLEVEVSDPPRGIDEIRVDVAGAVARPGVAVARPGDRVADAIEGAGGLAADADPLALNLARRVVDEDHILVPRRGERAALLDVNAATAEQLTALPGIGPAYAAAILAARSTGGPFISTDQLVDRGILPPHVYERVRDLIRVP